MMSFSVSSVTSVPSVSKPALGPLNHRRLSRAVRARAKR